MIGKHSPRQQQSPSHTEQTEKTTHTRCARQAHGQTPPRETHTPRPRDTDGHRQTEGPSDTNGDRQTKQIQTNAESQTHIKTNSIPTRKT